jgi:hypothetical protein
VGIIVEALILSRQYKRIILEIKYWLGRIFLSKRWFNIHIDETGGMAEFERRLLKQGFIRWRNGNQRTYRRSGEQGRFIRITDVK